MKFESMKKGTTSEFVMQQIREQIKDGTITIGERLPPERKLAEMIGVSRTSVREAIQSLVFSGYLTVIQGKGTFVTDSSPQYDELLELFTRINDFTIDHVMEVRILMEGGFASLAAQRATEEDLEEIASHYESMKKATDARDFFVKDLKLHAAIAAATKNPIMKSFMHIIVEKMHKETLQLVEMSLNTREASTITVGKLVEVLQNRDSRGARKYMKEHIMIVKNFLKDD